MDGKSYMDSVESTVGKDLANKELLIQMYNTCEARGEFPLFNDLAFTAMSIQKVRRVLAHEVPDEASRLKLLSEIDEPFIRFRALVTKLADLLNASVKQRIVDSFLMLTPQSFVGLQSLLADFSEVKRYQLRARDSHQEM